MRRWFLAMAMLLAGVASLGTQAQAQAWPSKPIRVIVPLTPGSATDVMARIVFEQVSAQLGQPIVIENRPGAGNTIGMGAVAQGRSRRLHHPGQFLDPHGDAGDALEPRLRDDRPRAHHPARQHAGGDAVQPDEGLQEAQRLRRLAPRPSPARSTTRRRAPATHRISTASVPAGGRLRSGAPAVQGRAGGDDRGDRRARRLLLLAAGQRAAVAEGRPAAGAGGERLGARLGVAGRADHGGSRLSELGIQFLGRRLRAGEDARRRSATSSMRKSPRRCRCRRSATSSRTSAPIRCRSPRRSSTRWCARRSRPTPQLVKAAGIKVN